jgi:hypothetical protein
LIALVEAGEGDRLAGHTLARIADALGARLRLQVLWHGENLDRLLDHRHATLVERTVRTLEMLGWHVAPEVTFQVGSERGSIDALAMFVGTGAVLVVEVKSVVPDVQATLAGLDRKARLAPRIATDRGWHVASVSRLLVLPEGTTTRRRIQLVTATLAAAYPARNVEVNRWLRAPTTPLSGILFLPDVNERDIRRRSSRSASRSTQGRGPQSS